MVKCRLLGADPTRKGLKLSLVNKKKAAATMADTPAEEATAAPAAEPAAGAKAASKGAPAALSAAATAEAGAALGAYQPGDLVQGTVTSVHTKDVDGEAVPAYFEVSVSPAAGAASAAAGGAAVIGRLDVAHLADHPVAAAALLVAAKVGTQLGPLLVLQRLEVRAAAGWWLFVVDQPAFPVCHNTNSAELLICTHTHPPSFRCPPCRM